MKLLLALVTLVACAQAAPAGFPAVGAAFPVFSLEDHAGVTVANGDLKGSYAVVEFVRSGDW